MQSMVFRKACQAPFDLGAKSCLYLDPTDVSRDQEEFCEPILKEKEEGRELQKFYQSLGSSH